MIQSTITSKYQTTVPKKIRQKLGLHPRDVLCWEVVGPEARVVPARRSFLDRRGSLRVGPGSAVDDVRRARARQVGGPRTKKVTVTEAPQEYVQRRQQEILELFGTIDYAPSYDYKRQR